MSGTEPAPLSRRLVRHLRANLVAYLALVVALAFTPLPSHAASLIGTAQLKNGAVTTPKLAKNAVATGKVKDGAITQAKLAAEAQGYTSVVARSAQASVANNTAGAVTASCVGDEVATGGGGFLEGAFTTPVFIRTYPSVVGGEGAVSNGAVPRAWTTRIYNNTGSPSTINGYVICASR
jgi:hypothetical protein